MRNIGPLVHKGSGQLRILYSFPLRIGTVGIGMTGWHQVGGLIAQGVRVHLYAGSCEKDLNGLRTLRQTMVVCGVKLPYRLIGHRRVLMLHDKIVAISLRQLDDKIDIIHCWPSGALETLRTARKLGIKTVLERPSAHTRLVYEITARECNKLGIKLNKSHYAAFSERKLAREEEEFSAADKLLCPSKYVMKTFLERGFKENQLLLGRRGYDPAFFGPPEWSGSENGTHPFKMAYIGECNPLKGLHFALQAWVASEASKKGRFYVCGNFLPEYRKVLTPLLAHPSVEYLGFTQEVAKVMRKCDALVLPSLSEGFPKVTCEARACGCVLLVSDAASEACEHMKNGLIHAPGDVKTLREQIDLLASDNSLLSRLRNNSLAGVSELTWDKASERLVEVYRQCLAGD